MNSLHSKKIAIYCGSNTGADPEFRASAAFLAKTLVEANITLVYGGAKVGIMGVIADTVLECGGKVIGVIPESIAQVETAHPHLSELHIVKTMHERKALIAELADGFIMLPGGPGSWEEFFEIMTWAKLGYHKKPCGILNVKNYYDHLIRFMDHAVKQRFLHEEHLHMVLIEQCPKQLLEKFNHYQPPTASAWIKDSASLA